MRHCKNRNMRKPGLKRSLIRSFMIHKKITTTVERAKLIKPVVERLITQCKKAESVSDLRLVRARVNDDDAYKSLVEDISPKFKERNGGYTRIVKLSTQRRGDSAKMAIISIVD
jgi:large subunit ribosomal protein L17